jgi:NADPH:quinone reductase-like Zn-dependent oxidoreductase
MSLNGMKSLRFAEFGPPSVLQIEEVAIPEPGEGEALVHISCR